jgi:lipid A 3-O-deacylase
MRLLLAFLPLCASLVFCGVSPVHAQAGPVKGSHELELWSGGGHALYGVTSHTSIWNVGLRYGWVLTEPHGPGLLRGRFECAVDVIPIFWVFQPQGRAYGGGFDPVVLKWDFDSHRRVVPYFELTGGGMVTNNQAPVGASRVNFTSGSAFGMHIVGKRLNWSAEVRFMHISNSAISLFNPGINTLQVRVGIGKFTHGGRL